jgi:hypothetical protein
LKNYIVSKGGSRNAGDLDCHGGGGGAAAAAEEEQQQWEGRDTKSYDEP